MKKLLIATFFLAVLLCSAVQAQSLDSTEIDVVQLINAERVRLGLNPLQVSQKLSEVADWMASDLTHNPVFGHTDTLGRDATTRMNQIGYSYATTKGEILAAAQTTASQAVIDWINSPSHYAAIQNPNYRVIGVSHLYSGGSPYGHYWVVEFGGYVDTLMTADIGPVGYATTVNAANYQDGGAPGQLSSVFGTFLNGSAAYDVASVLPLPTTLLTIEVRVNGQSAGLLYVSNNQINFQIPSGVGTGRKMVDVYRAGTLISRGNINLTSAFGGIFTARTDGTGAPAGQFTDGGPYELLFDNSRNAVPFTPGPDSKPTYLILYATGLSNVTTSGLQVFIGGYQCEVAYVGPQGQFAGLDQINIKLPGDLAARGTSVGGPGLTHINMVVNGSQIVNETEIMIK